MSAIRTKVLGLTALASLFAGASYGQIQVNLGGTARGAVQGSLNLRAEGTTEVVSTVEFNIANSGPAVTGSISVTYSAPVTSLVIPGGAFGATYASLAINGVFAANGTIGGGGQTVSFSSPAGFTFPAGTVGAPSSTIATVYNIRVNASAVAAASGLVAVTATPTVTTNNSSSVLPTASVPTVGFVFTTLSAPTLTGPVCATNGTACVPGGFPPIPPPNYNTAQGNPAKPAMAPSFYVGVGDSTAGAFKPWETGGALNVLGSGGDYSQENVDGHASYGTRIQLAFGNVPTGVTLYVPTSLTVCVSSAAGCTGALSSNFTLVLVSSATGADIAGPPIALPTPTAPPSFSAPNAGNLSYASSVTFFGVTTFTTVTYSGSAFSAGTYPLTSTGGSTAAVYEVLAAAPSTGKVSAEIPVYVTFAPASVSSASGAITVLASYAPNGAVAAATTDPDFAAVTTGALNGSSITIAQTSLLFPFVTSNAGFDTGIAISNTTTDPFGSSPATGTCSLNFYGTGAPTPNTGVAAPGGTQASGTSNAFLLSSVAPNFAGYMIAVCNYPDGHGFGYIIYNFGQNSGATMGYLATVLNRGPGVSVPAVETLGQ